MTAYNKFETIISSGRSFLILKEPIHWQELVNIVSRLKDRTINTMCLGRSKEVQDKYSRFIRDVESSGMTMRDMIIDEISQYSTYVSGDISFKITKNRFPYYFTPNLLHMLIWTDNNIFDIINLLEDNDINEFFNFVIFNNSGKIRSIDTNHYHLITTQCNLEHILSLFG